MGGSWNAEGGGEKRVKMELCRGAARSVHGGWQGHRLGTKGCCALVSQQRVLCAHLPSVAEQVTASKQLIKALTVPLGRAWLLEDRMNFTTY